MKTLEQLQAVAIDNNFASDHALWSACEAFILDASNSVGDRLKASTIIDRIVGEPPEYPHTEAGLQQMVADIKAARE